MEVCSHQVCKLIPLQAALLAVSLRALTAAAAQALALQMQLARPPAHA